jgi:hypothetical protein
MLARKTETPARPVSFLSYIFPLQSSTSSFVFPLCRGFIFSACDLSCVICRPLFCTHNTVVTVIPQVVPNGTPDLLCEHSGAAERRHGIWHDSTSYFGLCADAHQLFRRHIVWAEHPLVPPLLFLQSSLEKPVKY